MTGYQPSKTPLTTPHETSRLELAHQANDLPKDHPSRVDLLRKAAAAISEYLVTRLEADGRVRDDAHGILHGDDTQTG